MTIPRGKLAEVLKEIQRVSKGNSFITLGSYKNEKEYKQLKQWTLLGTILLKETEWKQVLKHVKYTGDYNCIILKRIKPYNKKIIMKILICGANGVVGRDLVYFLSKKHKILATYRNNKKNLFKNNNIKFTK